MSVSADAGVPRFLERYQRFEKMYEGDPKGLLRGLMPFLQTASQSRKLPPVWKRRIGKG